MSTCHRRITERRSLSSLSRVFASCASFSTPTPRLVPPAYTSSACAPAKPNDDDAIEPWFSVDTSLLVTYQTHTRAPCVYIYSTLASVTTVSKSLVERVVVRASPRSLPRASHNTQRTHTQRDDVRTRGARTRPSDNARARVRDIDRETHNTSLSVVHRLVVGLIPIRTIGIGCFSWFSVYYEWIIHIIYVLQMLRIYMEIAINGTRGIALYAPILRI